MTKKQLRSAVAGVFLLAAFSATPGSCSTTELAGSQNPPSDDDLPRLSVVAPELLRGGQPTSEGLSYLKSIGVKTIVNLRNRESRVGPEEQLARELGLNFVNIPMDMGEPESEEVQRFLAVVTDSANQPVFVHCREGRDRTGFMVAVYRICRQGWTPRAAYREMVAKGFHRIFIGLSRAIRAYPPNSAAATLPPAEHHG